MYFNYKVGALLLDIPPETIPDDISMDWVMTEFETHWKPLVYGSLVIAIAVASTAYLAISAIWHLVTMRRYRSRHTRGVGSIKGGKRPAKSPQTDASRRIPSTKWSTRSILPASCKSCVTTDQAATIFAVQLQHELKYLFAGAVIKVTRRLIRKHNRRTRNKRARNSCPLPLTT